MVSQTNEASLETQIESFLAKGCCIGNLVNLDRILQSAQNLFAICRGLSGQKMVKLKNRSKWQRLNKKVKRYSLLAVREVRNG